MHKDNALFRLTKETVTAIVWILNIAVILFYILTFDGVEQWVSKVIYAADCFFTLAYIVISLYNGVNKMQTLFIVLSLASLSVYYLFIIMYYIVGIDDYKYKIGVFLLTELLTVCFVFISGLRHGLFKNDSKTML